MPQTRLVAIDSKSLSTFSLPSVTSIQLVEAIVHPENPFTGDIYVSIGPSGPLVSPSGFSAHGLLTHTAFENRHQLAATVPQIGSWPLIKSFHVSVLDRDGLAVPCEYTLLVKVTF